MPALIWWMRVVGVLYVAMGVRLQPLFNAPLIPRMVRGWTASRQSPELRSVADWMGTFGLDLLAIGIVLLAFSRDAAAGRALVWVVIAREALGGIAADLWMIVRGDTSRAFYAGFIVFHLLIIASALLVLR